MRAALTAVCFLVPFLAPLLLRWWRARRWGLPVHVVVSPEAPSPTEIAGYLAEIARRLDARPERMRIVFDGRTARNLAIQLDLEPDGALRVSVEQHRSKRVDLRGRWIADHPVPLSLRRAVLYVDPVDANRFRVMSAIPFGIPPLVYVTCSLAATIGLVRLSPELLLLAIGLFCGCRLASR
ncbi:MAG: hypothetical protein ACI4RA_06365 [Kiritimatiellia bacterium]